MFEQLKQVGSMTRKEAKGIKYLQYKSCCFIIVRNMAFVTNSECGHLVQYLLHRSVE
jgi:hypothetical protein